MPEVVLNDPKNNKTTRKIVSWRFKTNKETTITTLQNYVKCVQGLLSVLNISA